MRLYPKLQRLKSLRVCFAEEILRVFASVLEQCFECLMVHQALAVSERSKVLEVSEVSKVSTTHLGMCHFAALCDARAC